MSLKYEPASEPLHISVKWLCIWDEEHLQLLRPPAPEPQN